MNIQDLPALPDRESETVEFLLESAMDTLVKTVAAFLNSRGGIVLVGYAEDGEHVGLESDPESLASRVRQELARMITPKESFHVTRFGDPERAALLVEVPQGARKPYLVSGRIYVRDGTTNVPATAEEISRLIAQRTTAEERWERRPFVGVGAEMLDAAEIERAVAAARGFGVHGTGGSALASLQALDLVAEGWPTGAAVALFISETHARNRLPQGRAQFAAFEDETLSLVSDRAEEVGGALRIMERLFGLVRSRLPSAARLPNYDLQREETTAYPLGAVREAIVNALMHRAYDDMGAVRVSLFPDRLEVWNPGTMPEAYIYDPEARLASRPHNPDMARIFNMLGYAEAMGIGLWRIRQEMLRAGSPEPVWRNHAGGVLLTLYRAHAGTRRSAERHELSARADALLRALAPDERVTTTEYRARFAPEISERSARNDMKALVRAGYLRRQGRGYQTTYVRSDKPLDDPS